jgi:outer membrane lipoprotein-sorting protein
MRHAGIVVLSAGLLSVTSAPVFADDLDRLMGLLAQRAHGHVSFEEEDRVALLNRPLHSSGELLYDRPDRLEKRTLAPKPASLVVQGDMLTLVTGHRRRVLALRDYPQLAPFVESLVATLAGDRRALERIFKVAFAGTLENWSLQLTPLSPNLEALVEEVRIDGTRAELRSLTILEADGDSSVMTIGPALQP